MRCQNSRMTCISYARSDVVFFPPGYCFHPLRFSRFPDGTFIVPHTVWVKLDTPFFYLKNFKTASLRKNITVYCTYFSFLSRTSVDTRFVIQSHIKTNTSKTVKSSPVNMSPATHLICLLPDSTLVVSNPVSLTVSNP